VSAARVNCGNQQEIPVDLLQVQVHFGAIIGENTIFECSIDQSYGSALIIAGPDPDQRQQAGRDPGHDAAIDGNARG
jgi:hypothetical protein